MRKPVCNHCGGVIEAQAQRCPHCGIPVLTGQHKAPLRRFIVFFVVVVLFCLLMIYWLPPDWSRFIPN